MTSLSPKIDTVIFDLDGTLRRSEPAGDQTFLAQAVKLGAPDDPEAVRRTRQWSHQYWATSDTLAQDFETFEGDQDGFWRNYTHRRLAVLGVDANRIDAMAQEISTYMQENFDPQDIIPDDVVPTLQAIKAAGRRVGLLTNRSNPVDDYLAETGLDQHLDFWVTSGEVQTWKPDPKVFLHALEVAQCAPQQAVYIGDNYYADVIGARAAAIQPVLFDPEGVFPEADCPVIRAIGEVPGLLGI